MDTNVIDKAKAHFEKVVQIVQEDLATVRTGRAKPDLVSGVIVSAYGSKMKLFEVANITAPDVGLIMISPWDKGLLHEIEKAIGESELKLSATVSGDSLRIIIPPLTEERRKDFVKLLSQKLEAGKVMVRQVRQDIKEEIDRSEGKAGVSEDDIKRELEQLQKLTEEYMTKVEDLAKAKEVEIMTF